MNKNNRINKQLNKRYPTTSLHGLYPEEPDLNLHRPANLTPCYCGPGGCCNIPMTRLRAE